MAQSYILLPELGESVMEAKLLKILKNVGDKVQENDVVAEVATDKVDSEIEAGVRGKIVHIAFKENDTVPVGAVLFTVETDETITKTGSPEKAKRSEKEEKIDTAKAKKNKKISGEALVNIADKTPAPIKEIKTEKVTPAEDKKPEKIKEVRIDTIKEITPTPIITSERNSFLSPLVSMMIAENHITSEELSRVQGTGLNGRIRKEDINALLRARKHLPLREISVVNTENEGNNKEDKNEGSTQNEVPTTNPINPQSSAQTIDEEKANYPTANVPETTNIKTHPKVEIPKIESTSSTKIFSHNTEESEAIKNAATDTTHTANTTHISTPETNYYENTFADISAQDYGNVMPNNTARKEKSVEIIEMSRMRSMIATHMRTSLETSAHATIFAEVDVTNMVQWREKNRYAFEEKYAEKITYTHLVVQAVACAMAKFPYINSSIDGDKIILKKNINIGIATALSSGDLIVPVVRDVDTLPLAQICRQLNALVKKARAGQLNYTDIEGGTFTLSNIGTFGSLLGTPIIQQPQVAILAVGAIKKKPVVCTLNGQDAIQIRQIMYLSFGFDHRIIDGLMAGGFLSELSHLLEHFDAPAL